MSEVENKHDDSGFESCDDESNLSVSEQVEDAIRELPCIFDKVQSIAINYYVSQKRELDKELEKKKTDAEHKTRTLYNPEVVEISNIVEGGYELSEEDFKFILDNKEMFSEEEVKEIERIMKKESTLEKGTEEISEYWLRSLGNADIVAEQMHGTDVEVLKNLYKVDGERNEDNSKLSLSFYFKKNKWFANEKLTKTFDINPKGEAIRSRGDEIEWMADMNYTEESVPQKSKKGKKRSDLIVKKPSFFHFFSSISSLSSENKESYDEDAWEELMEDLEVQLEISVHIYDDIVPKSLEFYLGLKGAVEEPFGDNLEEVQEVDEEYEKQVEKEQE